MDVTLAVDAAANEVVARADVVVAGADSIGGNGIVNKIGTRSAALAARDSGVPAYVLADTAKVLPADWPQWLGSDRAPAEVWDAAPPGVRVWNRYFEATPLAWFAGVVTERGMLSATDIETASAAIALPAELRRALA